STAQTPALALAGSGPGCTILQEAPSPRLVFRRGIIMSEPVILGAVRTPFGRRQGAFRETRPDQLLAHALQGLVQRVKIDPRLIEDVVNGTVTQINEQGANIGRLGVLLAGFPVQV